MAGRYALYGEIAAGGMATVHIGRLLGPVGFARTVAIKRLHPQYAKDPEFVSMFLDEARLAARVQHPNVVATIDVVATDGELFLIMDYVRGESLSRLIRAADRKGERVPYRIAASVVSGFLHGLHSAHEAKNEHGEPLGLVHRDVSPQNVLVGADGIARVLDFGIAKAAGRIQVTREGQIKGKLSYMPPEQLQGMTLTRLTDIYAAGVVLWETLTCERLFKGETESETLTKILDGHVERPSFKVPGLPPAFDEVVLKALKQNPEERFATAREMAVALEKCAGIASSTEVGEWVENTAGSELLEREERIAEIESSSAYSAGREDSSSDVSANPLGRKIPFDDSHALILSSSGHLRAADPVDAEAESVETMARPAPAGLDLDDPFTSVEPHPPHEDKRNKFIFAALIGLAFFFGVLAIYFFTSRQHERGANRVAPAPSLAASVASTPSASPPEVAIAIASASPSASAPSSAAPSASATPTSTRLFAGSSNTGSAQGVSPGVKRPLTAPPPPPASPGKGCDPPYTVDSNGRRHYKLECLN